MTNKLRYGVSELGPAADAALARLPPGVVGVLVIGIPADQSRVGHGGMQCKFGDKNPGVTSDWLIETLRWYADVFEEETNDRLRGAQADRGVPR